MIFENEGGTIIIQMGTGDIEVGNGRISSDDGNEMIPCCVFIEAEECLKIGEPTRPDEVLKPAIERSDAHTVLAFTNVESVNVVLNSLERVRDRLIKNGTRMLTVEEIRDE